jgi:exo-1,4-beta-D-glucosaminidase
VYLRASGAVLIGSSMVSTELPLPHTDSARLSIYSSLHNTSAHQVHGALRATISRAGKADIEVEQPVTLGAGETRQVSLDPDHVAALTVQRPDLWWPYRHPGAR